MKAVFGFAFIIAVLVAVLSIMPVTAEYHGGYVGVDCYTSAIYDCSACDCCHSGYCYICYKYDSGGGYSVDTDCTSTS